MAVHLCGNFKCTLHNGDRAQGQCVHWAYMRSRGLIPSCPVLATDKYSCAQVTEGGACLGLRFEGDGFTLPKMPDSQQQEQETKRSQQGTELEVGWGCELSKPTLSDIPATHFFQQGCKPLNPLQTALPTGDQVFKYLSIWGTRLIQTTTSETGRQRQN